MLLDNEFFSDSISRSYYAVMHAAKAALLIYDIHPQSHNSVRNQFGRFLVKTDEIEPEYAHILANEQDSRIYADYICDYEFPFEQAQDYFRDAERFVKRIQSYLHSKEVHLSDASEI